MSTATPDISDIYDMEVNVSCLGDEGFANVAIIMLEADENGAGGGVFFVDVGLGDSDSGDGDDN